MGSSCRAEPHTNSMTYGVCFGETSVALYRYMASDVHKLSDSYSCDDTILSAGGDTSTRPQSLLLHRLQRLRFHFVALIDWTLDQS
jgi:hypothetical protein